MASSSGEATAMMSAQDEEDAVMKRKRSRSSKKASSSSSSSSKRIDSSDAMGSNGSSVMTSSSRSASGALVRANGEASEDGWSSPSSPPTSPMSYPLTSREENELRALRADVESLKQSLAAATLSSSSPSVALLHSNARFANSSPLILMMMN